MTKANGRILGSLIALSLVMGATGTARAGLNMQGLNMQGLNMQGLNMQGLNMQGLNMQGLNMQGVTLSAFSLGSGKFASGTLMGSPSLWQGNQLRAYNGATLVTDSGLIGSTFPSTITFDDGTITVDKNVTLTISDVIADSSTNTMMCDPTVGQYQSNCGYGYNQNTGIKLYKITYKLAETGNTGYLCGGDQYAMLFKGAWAEDGSWSDDGTNKITVACTTGVVAKCARNWGYKPWKTMIDKYGNARDMRDYHQACTRVARADYSGVGFPFTMTGMPIDIFDNGGFNVPTPGVTLQGLGYEASVRFESFFTYDHLAVSPKKDAWGKFLGSPRMQDIGLFIGQYGYEDINWDLESPKGKVYIEPVTTWISYMDSRYASQRAEIVAYNPVWSQTGTNVRSGNTGESWDHASPSCANSTAPDRAFRWTAPLSGQYTFTTAGSTYDTVLYIWDNNVEIGCSDDVGPLNTSSSVTKTLTAGQEILIFVDGYGTAKGDYKLNIAKL